MIGDHEVVFTLTESYAELRLGLGQRQIERIAPELQSTHQKAGIIGRVLDEEQFQRRTLQEPFRSGGDSFATSQ